MTDKGKERQMKERGNDGREMTLYSSHSRELTSSKSLEKPMRPGVKEGWARREGELWCGMKVDVVFVTKLEGRFQNDRLGLL